MEATLIASSLTSVFVLRVPSNLNLAGVAPLLCAGITTYSPIRRWGVSKGKHVGVAGQMQKREPGKKQSANLEKAT
jgi:hypothetical protein